VYRPPFEEFEVQLVSIPAGEAVAVPTNPGPLLLLVTGGAGSVSAAGGALPAAAAPELRPEAALRRGSVVFVPAGASLTYTAEAGGGDLQVWAAAVNARVFAPTVAPVAAEEEEVEEEEVEVAAPVGAAAKEPALVAA
jgi:mannose-6-phosphate isomerase